MKKIFTLLLALAGFQTFAQTNSSTSSDTLSTLSTSSPAPEKKNRAALKDINREEVFRKNILKINLSSLALKNYSLSYERSLTRKVTFVAGYSFLPKTKATSISVVDKGFDQLGDDDEIVDQLRNSTVASKAYTGEIRLYTGGKPGARGFYISLYGRHMNLDATYSHEYETDFRTYTIPIDGNIKGFGGGLMIGSQWLIAKRVSFDWYILGGHYGKMKLDLNGMADLSTMTTGERRDLEEDIESINDDLPGNVQINATVTNTGVTVKGNSPFAGIRGLGFNLGIAF